MLIGGGGDEVVRGGRGQSEDIVVAEWEAEGGWLWVWLWWSESGGGCGCECTECVVDV